uniref:Uncharacterized protein n=1 Tax=Arundo donax TaxID=35708 RepID=A0A0A9DY42_ARUDO
MAARHSRSRHDTKNPLLLAMVTKAGAPPQSTSLVCERNRRERRRRRWNGAAKSGGA